MDNGSLRSMYEEFFGTVKLGQDIAKRCSPPLLVSVESRWKQNPRRLLIVGQEVLGWSFQSGEYYDWPYSPITCYSDFSASSNGVDALMYGYRVFAFAEKQPENYRSPFWRAFRYLSSKASYEAIWSNLFRFSVDGGSVIRNCSESELNEVFNAQSGLLRKEIQILCPSAIVFFTGPDYEQFLVKSFPDVVYVPVGSHEERQFVRLSAEGLPYHAYRTYHPGHLARYPEKWKWLDELVQLIAVHLVSISSPNNRNNRQ